MWAVSFGALFESVIFGGEFLMSVAGALMGSSFRYVIPTGEEAVAGKKRVEHLGSKMKVTRSCRRVMCDV